MTLSDAVVGLIVLVVLLGSLWLIGRSLVKPLIFLVVKFWQSRTKFNPLSQQGGFNFLGVAIVIFGLLLIIEGRGYEVFDSILARMNIDPTVIRQHVGIMILLNSCGFGCMYPAIFCFARAKRFDARSAVSVLSEDNRPPVVYLRSFPDDLKASRRLATTASLRLTTEEDEITEIVREIGPMIAIGRPGEKLAYTGAARMYVGDDEWREEVCHLLSYASLAILRAGETDGVLWEIKQVIARVSPERIIILIPFGRSRYERFRLKTEGFFQYPLPVYEGRWLTLTSIRAVLFFDSTWNPNLVPITNRSSMAFLIRFLVHKLFGGRTIEEQRESDVRRVLGNVLRPILRRLPRTPTIEPGARKITSEHGPAPYRR